MLSMLLLFHNQFVCFFFVFFFFVVLKLLKSTDFLCFPLYQINKHGNLASRPTDYGSRGDYRSQYEGTIHCLYENLFLKLLQSNVHNFFLSIS